MPVGQWTPDGDGEQAATGDGGATGYFARWTGVQAGNQFGRSKSAEWRSSLATDSDHVRQWRPREVSAPDLPQT